LHQLLGLRLRFYLRGKYSDVFTPIFQRNFVDLFWPVFAAATECKRVNVGSNFKIPKPQKKCQTHIFASVMNVVIIIKTLVTNNF
jgi:hypothetical protein